MVLAIVWYDCWFTLTTKVHSRMTIVLFKMAIASVEDFKSLWICCLKFYSFGSTFNKYCWKKNVIQAKSVDHRFSVDITLWDHESSGSLFYISHTHARLAQALRQYEYQYKKLRLIRYFSFEIAVLREAWMKFLLDIYRHRFIGLLYFTNV